MVRPKIVITKMIISGFKCDYLHRFVLEHVWSRDGAQDQENVCNVPRPFPRVRGGVWGRDYDNSRLPNHEVQFPGAQPNFTAMWYTLLSLILYSGNLMKTTTKRISGDGHYYNVINIIAVTVDLKNILFLNNVIILIILLLYVSNL